MKHILNNNIPKRYIIATKLLIKLGIPKRIKKYYFHHINDGTDPEKALLYTIQTVFSIIHPDAQVVVKHNQAYYLIKDSHFMLSLARKAKFLRLWKLENRFARSAILLYPVALEALINSVYEYCESPQAEKLSSIPLKKKWFDAPKSCLPYCGLLSENELNEINNGGVLPSFEEKSELFQSYIELKNIRNDIVHLKAVFNQIQAKDLKRYKGISGHYPISGIPYSIGAWRFKDAHKAYKISSRMISQLDVFLRGEVSRLLRGPRLVEWMMGLCSFSQQKTAQDAKKRAPVS